MSNPFFGLQGRNINQLDSLSFRILNTGVAYIDSTGTVTTKKISIAEIEEDVALPGAPTTSTAVSGTNTQQIATTAYVSNAIADLVSSAPETLNTLKELSLALGNDENFSTTVTNSIAGKVSLTGDETINGIKTFPDGINSTTANIGGVTFQSNNVFASGIISGSGSGNIGGVTFQSNNVSAKDVTASGNVTGAQGNLGGVTFQSNNVAVKNVTASGIITGATSGNIGGVTFQNNNVNATAMTATTFNGNLNGNANTATTASNASSINITGSFQLRIGQEITAGGVTTLLAPLAQFYSVVPSQTPSQTNINLPAPTDPSVLGAFVTFKKKQNTGAFNITAGTGVPSPFIFISGVTAVNPITVNAGNNGYFQMTLICDGVHWCVISQA